MSTRPRLAPLLVALAGLLLPVVPHLSAHGQGIPPAPQTLRRTPAQVADTLDAIMQPKFLNVTENRFGADRLSEVPGHIGMRLRTDTPEEKATLQSLNDSGYRYAVVFYRTKPLGPRYSNLKPKEERLIRFGVLDGRAGRGLTDARVREIWAQAVEKNLPLLASRPTVNAQEGEWFVALRPVLARQACLSCHTGTKVGDTLAVMAYLVQPKPAEDKPASR